MRTVNLNGTWDLMYARVDWKIAAPQFFHPFDWSQVAKAEVPGDVHLDMLRAGLIDDPYFDRNSDHCLWMENVDWWYHRQFEVPADFAGKTMILRFAGLDTYATVYLNGEWIGQHANMFTPLELDVSKLVRVKGPNELLVKLGSPIHSLTAPAPERCTLEAPDEYRTGICTNEPPNVYTRKAAMSYGWDVAPRLLTAGIWKEVELRTFDAARITDLYIHTDSIANSQAAVRCEVEVQKEAAGAVALELQISIAGQRKTLSVEQIEHRRAYTFDFCIANPQLWWPNGYGAQPLYRCTADLRAAGAAIDQRELDFGIRTVELVQEQQAHGATSFYFRINGRRIFAQGFNWSPPDAIFARTGAPRYAELLQLVKDCGANMLRMCGIGVYEQEPFYQLCDRFGILIWQDFMVTNFMYPMGDRDFVRNLREEVESVVKDLRSHACVALWCGDNESDLRWADWSRPAFNRVNKEIIPGVLQRLDTIRPYWPSSPFSPDSSRDLNDRLSGDCHLYASGQNYQRPNIIAEPRCPRFISENGYWSCPDKEVLRQFVGDAEIWPTENKVWWHHSTDTRFAGNRANVQALHDGITNNGRPAPQNVDEFIQATQEVHAEALVAWFDAAASDPECGGILFWNLCDCWPQISGAVIGYPLKPKLAYHAVSRAFNNHIAARRAREQAREQAHEPAHEPARAPAAIPSTEEI